MLSSYRPSIRILAAQRLAQPFSPRSLSTAKVPGGERADAEVAKTAPKPKKRITIPHSKLPRVPAAEFMDHEDFKLQRLFARGGAIYAPELFHVIPQKKLFMDDILAEGAQEEPMELSSFNEWSTIPADLNEPLIYFETPDERAARLAPSSDGAKRGRRKPKSLRN